MAKLPEFKLTSREQIAKFFGRSVSTVQKWSASGMPGRQGDYNLQEIVQWRESTIDERITEARRDPEMYDGGGDSPNLEEYRKWRAEREKLTVEELRGVLVRMDVITPKLNALADLLRGLGERLQKRCGPEAVDMINEVIDDWDRKLSEDFDTRDEGVE